MKSRRRAKSRRPAQPIITRPQTASIGVTTSPVRRASFGVTTSPVRRASFGVTSPVRRASFGVTTSPVRRSSAAAQTTEALVEVQKAEQALLRALRKGPVSPRDLQRVHDVVTGEVADAIRALKSVEPAVEAPVALPKPSGDVEALLAQIAFLKAELAAARATASAAAAGAPGPEAEEDIENLPEPKKSKVIMGREYKESSSSIANFEFRYSKLKENLAGENAARVRRGKPPIPEPVTLLQFYLGEKAKSAPKPVAERSGAAVSKRAGQRADPCARVPQDPADETVVPNFDYWNNWVGRSNFSTRRAFAEYINQALAQVEGSQNVALSKIRSRDFRPDVDFDEAKLRRYFAMSVGRAQELTDLAKDYLIRIKEAENANSQRVASILLENVFNARECLAKIILDSENAAARLKPPADFEREAPRRAVAAPSALAGLFAARAPGGPSAAGAGAPESSRGPPPLDPRAALLASLKFRPPPA